MAAGEQATFDQVKPELDALGENVFHLGALRAGHTTKLINNFMGMTSVCAMSQAFAVADRAGVDRQQLFDIMSAGPSNSPFMKFCKNCAVDGASDLGFSIANAHKDLGYFLQMVEDLGIRAPLPEAPHPASKPPSTLAWATVTSLKCSTTSSNLRSDAGHAQKRRNDQRCGNGAGP